MSIEEKLKQVPCCSIHRYARGTEKRAIRWADICNVCLRKIIRAVRKD